MIDHSDKALASSSADGSVVIWELNNQRQLQKLQQLRLAGNSENSILGLAYMYHNHSLAAIDSSRRLTFIDLHGYQTTHSIEAAYDGQLTVLAYNHQKNEVAVGDDAGEIKIFNCNDGKMLHLDQVSHSKCISAIGYNPDGTKLVTADSDGKILIWRVNN